VSAVSVSTEYGIGQTRKAPIQARLVAEEKPNLRDDLPAGWIVQPKGDDFFSVHLPKVYKDIASESARKPNLQSI
jgi:hypothetical protein